MAAAFTDKLSRGRVKTISAGTEPAKVIDPTVVKVMGEVGTDISHQKPKGLTPEMIEQADKIITMGCRMEEICPATLVETEDWDIDNPKEKPMEKVRQIMKQVQAKVRGLLEEIP